MLGVVTTKSTVAEDCRVAASQPTTGSEPAGEVGTVKLHLNPPVEFVRKGNVAWIEPAEQAVGVRFVPWKETLAPESGVNPEPVTTNVAPIGPWPGLTEMAGVSAGVSRSEAAGAGGAA